VHCTEENKINLNGWQTTSSICLLNIIGIHVTLLVWLSACTARQECEFCEKQQDRIHIWWGEPN